MIRLNSSVFVDGTSIGLQLIFVGTAFMFLLIVSLVLLFSASKVLRKHAKNTREAAGVTIISNHRNRLVKHTSVRQLLADLTQKPENSGVCTGDWAPW